MKFSFKCDNIFELLCVIISLVIDVHLCVRESHKIDHGHGVLTSWPWNLHGCGSLEGDQGCGPPLWLRRPIVMGHLHSHGYHGDLNSIVMGLNMDK